MRATELVVKCGLVIISLMLIFIRVSTAQAAATFDLGTVNGAAGAQVTVPVTLTTAGASIASLSIDIGYDTTQLSVPMSTVDPTKPSAATRGPAITVVDEYGDPIKDVVQSLPIGTTGVLRLGVLKTGNTTAIGDGIVVNVKFNVLAGTSGTLVLTNTPGASDPSGNSVGITGSNGAITIPSIPTVPGAPTGVTGTVGNGQIRVAFTAPTSTGGSTISGYTVTSSPGSITATGTSSPITVTGLTNGTAYTFTVTATNATGTSAASTASAAVTPATVPGAPTGVSAAVGNGQAAVSFTAPSSIGGSAITGYTVTSSPGCITGTGSASPIVVTGLTNGTAYTFTVTATNAAGTGAASTASASITPITVTGAPTGVTATAGNAQASVAFTAPTSTGGSAITGYTVTSSPGSITVAGSASPIVVTGLTNGTAYTFTVKATNAAGASVASTASSSVSPQATAPGAPTGVSAALGNALAIVSFTAPASNGGSVVTGYTVTSSPGGITGTGSASPIVVTGLTNGTAYTFTVTATNAAGTGAASTASASITPITVPGAPTGASATAGNGQASVAFTAPGSTGGSAITGYSVTSSPGGITGTGSASPIVVTGLTNGTAYTFTVKATNAAGASVASTASSSVTPQATAPEAPTGVSAVPGNGQATISFTAPASNGGAAISGYTVTSSAGNKTATGSASTITVTGLTNGIAYTFTVVATNSKGDSPASPASNSVTPNILTPVIGQPSATLSKAGTSISYTVTYTGADAITLAAGDVTINKTGTANGTAAVSGSGVTLRTVTLSGLTGDGTLGISIAAGTASSTGGAITASVSSASSTFIVDNTAPTLTVSTLANNTTTSNNTLTITGTTSDANAVQTVTVNGSSVAVTNGAFNTSVTLVSGSNTITVVATDTIGNQITDTRTIVYDHTAPVITFIAPTPADQSFTNMGTATIVGSLSKTGSLQVTVNSNTPVTITTSGVENSFTTPVTLVLGANTISVVASDTATPANTTTVQRNVTYDSTAPVLTITDPDQAITTTYSSYLVRGSLSDNFTGSTLSFTVDGVTVTPAPTVAGNGTFQQSVSFTEGKTYAVAATARDQAGNSTTVQRNIIYRPIGLADALRALKISMAIETYDLAKGDDKLDVAPLVGGKPQPDGVVDAGDAVVLLKRTIGLVNW